MKSYTLSLAAALLFCAVWTASAFAQTDEARRMPDQEEARMMRGQDEIVSFDPVYRAVDSDPATVDILFRVRHDFLVFARSLKTAAFEAEAEVTVEILDSAGVSSVARSIHTLTLSSSDNAQTYLRRSFEQGFVSFRLKPGRYLALCIVTDKESAHKQFTRRIPIRIPHARLASSSLILARSVDPSGVTPSNFGGNVEFHHPVYAVVALPSRVQSIKATYSLDEMKMDDEERTTVQKDTTVQLTVYTHTTIVPAADSARGILYRFTPDTSHNIAVLSLNGERLAQGRHMLHVAFDAQGDTATMMLPFTVRWIDMPQSLRDLDFATSAMKYITTEEEYDKLTSGRASKRIDAFMEFWKKRDPTPETAYNEQLAEYFRRVDYAAQNFRTLKEENGVFTDRGKIFILYGTPAKTERQLSPTNAPREVWSYPSLRKLFTFEDSSRQGNYKLIKTDTQ
ncbi:MAG TPA: GWxTD domain-containing protein [Bacteroidota bacterium]|nr:GWxTD domain-containing protein [Bacteroidota bacterium]